MINASTISAEDLLNRLGLENARLTAGGDEINFSCFGGEHSHGDERPSAYINVESKLWFCHGCKRSGTAVSLVSEVQQVTRPQAERWLRDTYGISFNEPIAGSMVDEVILRFSAQPLPHVPVRPPVSFLSSIRFDWINDRCDKPQEYMLNRGFVPEILNEWGVGYDYDSDRLTIPIFDVDGELFGIKARGWREDQQPKYLILGDRGFQRYGFEPYEGTEVVFGLHRNRSCKTGVLVEGELNAIALSQLGVERPIANGMSYLSDRHARLIANELDEVILFYDDDPAGTAAVWGRPKSDGGYRLGAAQLLEPYCRVRVVSSPPEDPAGLLQIGQGQLALDLIEAAPSALALTTPLV